MDVDSFEYSTLATAYNGMTDLFNSALLESVPEEFHNQQFLIRRYWNIVVRKKNIALSSEEIEAMRAIESAITDNLNCLIENVALLQVLSTNRSKGTVVNLVKK